MQLVALAGEAMGDGVLHAVMLEDFVEARMGIARVEEKRLAELQAELELRDEPLLLVRVRRVVAIEVEAALADGDHARVPGELTQRGDGLRAAVARVMRMHAGGGVEIELLRDADRRASLVERRARDDDLRHAGFARAAHGVLEIVRERGVSEVRADVDELHLLHETEALREPVVQLGLSTHEMLGVRGAAHGGDPAELLVAREPSGVARKVGYGVAPALHDLERQARRSGERRPGGEAFHLWPTEARGGGDVRQLLQRLDGWSS